jgi:CRP/FNR family transcriptional regulator, cyclic AMP receptor protein
MVKSLETSLREEMRMLSSVDFLEPLWEKESQRLLTNCPDLHFDAGEIFSTPWEEEERLFIIKEGRMRVYKLGHKGQEQTIAEIGYGTALATQWLRGSYTQAVEPTTIVSMGREDLKHIIAGNPEVALKLIEVLAGRLSRADERLADVALKGVPARLANLILQLLEDEGAVTSEGYMIPADYTQERLGIMIGARRTAVTPAFQKLREIGVLEVKRRKIHVKDVGTLKCIARDGA